MTSREINRRTALKRVAVALLVTVVGLTVRPVWAVGGSTTSVGAVSVSVASASSVIVTWSAPTSGAGTVSSYEIDYRESQAGSWTPFAPSAPISGTQAEVTGLTAGVTYEFRVLPIVDSVAQLAHTYGVKQLVAGANHTCELFDSGTVSCWGSNGAGQLGITLADAATYTSIPVSLGLSDVSKISAGREHTCALKLNGDVYCWGSNSNGQGGNGDNTVARIATPQRVVNLSNVVDISAGSMHTCAVLSDGTAKCWGTGAYARLGYEATPTNNADQYSPMPVLMSDGSPLSGLTHITAGTAQTCGLKSDGTVLCWGNNNAGQLGRGGSVVSGNTSNTPSPVVSLTNVRQISSGHQHVCAVTTTNAVYCWGAGTKSQIGNGASANIATPTAVKLGAGTLTGVAEVVAGWESTCAVTLDGLGYCWGANNSGQLGDGSTTTRNTATRVGSLAELTTITVDRSSNTTGAGHSCALTSGSVVYCWGLNSILSGSDGPRGALGNATIINSSTPVVVSGIQLLNVKVTTSPGPATWLSVTPGDQAAHLAWTLPTDNGSELTDLSVQFASGDMSGTACVVLVSATSCEVSNLTNGIAYIFTIKATNGIGQGDPVDSAAVTPGRVPDASQWIAAVAADHSIVLSWINGAANGSDVSSVEVRFVDGDKSGIACAPLPNETQCTVDALTNGVPYSFSITQTNTFGESDPATSALATPGRTPDPVGTLTARGSGTSVTLTWPLPAANGATVSQISVHFASGDRMGTACLPAAQATQCVVSGLTPGVQYSFALVSTNSFGDSTATTSGSWTPYVTPSKVLSLTSRQAATSSIAWKWNAPSSLGGSSVLRYEYQVAKNGKSWPTKWISTGTLRGVTVGKLAKKSTTYIRVRVVARSGLTSVPVVASRTLR